MSQATLARGRSAQELQNEAKRLLNLARQSSAAAARSLEESHRLTQAAQQLQMLAAVTAHGGGQ